MQTVSTAIMEAIFNMWVENGAYSKVLEKL